MDRRYKRPESVLVVVYTRDGQALALRRCRPPDFWQSVTGSLEWQETEPSQAARRELREETGLGDEVDIVDCGVSNRFPILPQWRSRYAPGVQENVEYVFRVELPQPVFVRIDPSEHWEYRWLPREEAAAKMSSWTNREAVLRFVPVPRD